MSESNLILTNIPKPQAYKELSTHVDNILYGITDQIAEMATISSLVHHAFGLLWTGFYRTVKPNALLRVGPYQGTLGCLEIEFGRGVCGTAAAQKQTIIVPDVSTFPGHISCDARSKSEIVLPVFDANANVIAVFDLDADTIEAFTEEDKIGLEAILKRFSRKVRSTK